MASSTAAVLTISNKLICFGAWQQTNRSLHPTRSNSDGAPVLANGGKRLGRKDMEVKEEEKKADIPESAKGPGELTQECIALTTPVRSSSSLMMSSHVGRICLIHDAHLLDDFSVVMCICCCCL